jgi:hypothetical protein
MKFADMLSQWKDYQYENEYNAKREQHAKRLNKLAAIKEEVARVHEIIKMNRRDEQRRNLLHWLSPVDTSINYNSARESHEPLTGDWLVLRNKVFRKWIDTKNSLLWLNGKGGSSIARC